jgi:hypothetical protein
LRKSTIRNPQTQAPAGQKTPGEATRAEFKPGFFAGA